MSRAMPLTSMSQNAHAPRPVCVPEIGDEQRWALDGICQDVAQTATTDHACRLIADRVSALLIVPAAMLSRDRVTWKLEHQAFPAAADERPRPAGGFERLAQAADEPVEAIDLADADAVHWTGVPLGAVNAPAWILLLPCELSEWRATSWFEPFVRELSLSLQVCALKQAMARREEIVLSAYTLSRQLAETSGIAQVHALILETMARTARAEIGALAVYHPDEKALTIAATHGYPSVLVEHVRITPGAGVIGRVFTSREPLLVREASQLLGLPPRRLRYRTDSFLAVPLVGADGVLGVVALADRSDGQPFEHGDLTAVRALAAPAALALAREQLVQQAHDLTHAATIDPLTGLFNRRYLQTRLEGEIERARRHGLDLALLLVDIDDFKSVNDSLGHLAGDAVLRVVAEVLRRSVRVFDVCTRYGGEEFAILMPGSSAGSVLQSAERIRTRVEAYRPPLVAAPSGIALTVSIGVAILTNDLSGHALLALADRALYRAKAEGKNCVRLEVHNAL